MMIKFFNDNIIFQIKLNILIFNFQGQITIKQNNTFL